MADVKPPAIVELTWDSGLSFTARDATHAWVLDGRNQAGPSPPIALVSALAGCMSIDVVDILTKGRHAVRALSTRVVGHRAEQDPRRLVRVEMRFVIDTDATAEHIQRAIDLSRDKYCSVWHSMRQDIELTATIITPGVFVPAQTLPE
ncbi:MAG: OsmC family protein [Acidobacteriota bacterium]